MQLEEEVVVVVVAKRGLLRESSAGGGRRDRICAVEKEEEEEEEVVVTGRVGRGRFARPPPADRGILFSMAQRASNRKDFVRDRRERLSDTPTKISPSAFPLFSPVLLCRVTSTSQ